MSTDIVKEIANAPQGTLKLYKGNDIGLSENSIITHMDNTQNIGKRIDAAINAGCFIEALSLRLQIVDFWLRIYFRNTRNEGEQRRREFGRLLDQCKKLGLDNSLFTKLKEFNNHRVDAIHGYVIGKTTYEALKPIVAESKKLSSETIAWVLENCGEVISNAEGRAFKVGDTILKWKTQIQKLSA